MEGSIIPAGIILALVLLGFGATAMSGKKSSDVMAMAAFIALIIMFAVGFFFLQSLGGDCGGTGCPENPMGRRGY